jgi:predicted RNA-binding protein
MWINGKPYKLVSTFCKEGGILDSLFIKEAKTRWATELAKFIKNRNQAAIDRITGADVVRNYDLNPPVISAYHDALI